MTGEFISMGYLEKKETQYTPERLIALLVEVKIENGSMLHRGIEVLQRIIYPLLYISAAHLKD